MGTFEDRLQQFIQMENLTPAKLADAMGIQRGGLSHLLAGRNKPSYDFITRLLDLYPDLSPEWFLLGKGKPYSMELPFQTETEEVNEEITAPEPRENRISDDKFITRLIIFYSDGTYEER